MFVRLRPFVPLAATLAVLILWLVAVPIAFGAPGDPTTVTQRSCAFGASWSDSLLRIIAGALVVVGLIMAAVIGVFRRLAEGGGAVIGGLISVLDFGAGAFLIALVPILAGLAIAAAGMVACPS